MGSAAWADEVIKFQNGTYMTIERHTVVGQMVLVVLGANSTMAFPRSMIQDIERGGVSVFKRRRSTPNVVNRGGVEYSGKVSLNSAPTSFGYTVHSSAPSSSRGTSNSARRRAMMVGDPAELLLQQQQEQQNPSPDSASMFVGHESASHRRFAVTGNTSLVNGYGFRPGDPGQEPVIEGQKPPRKRGQSIQPRAVPLPTHPNLPPSTGEGDHGTSHSSSRD